MDCNWIELAWPQSHDVFAMIASWSAYDRPLIFAKGKRKAWSRPSLRWYVPRLVSLAFSELLRTSHDVIDALISF